METGETMLRILLCSCLALGLSVGLQAQQKRKSKAAPKTVTLTGCVDSQPGEHFVLKGDVNLKKIARLEGVRFANERFAKYLGHTISVTGHFRSKSDPVVVGVTKIKHISELCMPNILNENQK